MKVVILAGGLGTRLSEETVRIPKPMVEIGGRPMLWHIMKIYSAHGLNDFIICLGYKGYIIKEFFLNYAVHMSDITIDVARRSVEVHHANAEPWRITLVETGADSQTGGRVKRVGNYLPDGEPFCLTYGDGLADVNIPELLAFHRSHGRMATVTAVNPPGRWGVLQVDHGSVVGFAEKVNEGNGLVNGGFFVLEKPVLDLIAGDHTVWEHEPLKLLAECHELRAYHHMGFWQAMDTLREMRMLDDMWNQGCAPWKVW